MFLSRVQIKLCEESLQYLDGLAKNDSYATHQLLWNLFPDDPVAKRDFIYRAEQNDGWPLYFVLSKRKPISSSKMFTINTRDFSPVLTVGQNLMFDVRVNPVVSRKIEGKKNGAHHDVWMDAKKKALANNLNPLETEKLKIEYVVKWLLDRADRCGFSFDKDRLQITSYQQHRAIKKSADDLLYSTIDYRGSLTVTDIEKFKYTLENGIGRSKAFGCGLLLIKPVNDKLVTCCL
jgi:CRISPR system Cascade subunit CasE